jgi:hypothetical protein
MYRSPAGQYSDDPSQVGVGVTVGVGVGVGVSLGTGVFVGHQSGVGTPVGVATAVRVAVGAVGVGPDDNVNCICFSPAVLKVSIKNGPSFRSGIILVLDETQFINLSVSDPNVAQLPVCN